jgi:hypothetical protein
MGLYRIKYSDNSGTHHVIKSVSFVHEDAEDWAQDREQLQAVRRHIHRLEPEEDRIQVWEFEEVKGLPVTILNFFKGN